MPVRRCVPAKQVTRSDRPQARYPIFPTCRPGVSGQRVTTTYYGLPPGPSRPPLKECFPGPAARRWRRRRLVSPRISHIRLGRGQLSRRHHRWPPHLRRHRFRLQPAGRMRQILKAPRSRWRSLWVQVGLEKLSRCGRPALPLHRPRDVRQPSNQRRPGVRPPEGGLMRIPHRDRPPARRQESPTPRGPRSISSYGRFTCNQGLVVRLPGCSSIRLS